MIDGEIEEATRNRVSDIIQRGGTVIGDKRNLRKLIRMRNYSNKFGFR